MGNIAADIDPKSVRCGTTNGVCPTCRHSGDMERWGKATPLRVLGIPIPLNRIDEIVRCTQCGSSRAAA